jgi:hypothetical protein
MALDDLGGHDLAGADPNPRSLLEPDLGRIADIQRAVTPDDAGIAPDE